MDTFTPSIDWSNEVAGSLWWLAEAWTISGAGLLAVGTLIARYTTWGRQFWEVTGGYFKGHDSIPVWGRLGLLLMLVMVAVRINILLSYYSNDLYTALQVAFEGAASGDMRVRNSGIHGFWVAIATFAVLAVIYITRAVVDQFLMQEFIIRWRVWLTHRLMGDWLGDRAYYRGQFIDHPIDNPDQRIQQDIDAFTACSGGMANIPANGTAKTLLFGAVQAVVSVVSFAAILWDLSFPITVAGLQIPRALFWIVIAYITFATVVAFWIGRPLIRLSFRNEKLNAIFRYALVRLRDAGEAVGFYRGERAESVELNGRFAGVIRNYRGYLRRSVAFTGFNVAVSQPIGLLPFLIQAPQLFAGSFKLGYVMQSTQAFGTVHDSLSFFRNAYDLFASYRASILRVHGLVESNAKTRALPKLHTAPSVDGSVELDEVEVRTPDGLQLVDPLSMRLAPGDSMVIVGRSGSGKTTLLRSLAQLWPFTSGTLRHPSQDNATMFLSQLPYVPLGNLRAVVSYPAAEGDIADRQLRDVLAKVALAHLRDRLDQVRDWAKVLSPGEQQRIAFARILLTRPRAVFLDEATSALDPGLEYSLYQLLRTELPETVVVSVSHRNTVEPHHEQQLALLGGGAWRVGKVGERGSMSL